MTDAPSRSVAPVGSYTLWVDGRAHAGGVLVDACEIAELDWRAAGR